MKNLIRKVLGDEYLGFIDYYRYPSWKCSWGGASGGAFNGQQFRCKIFYELNSVFDFCAIFETGTFHGSTTVFMAQSTNKPIYTVEGQKRTYGYCKARFKSIKNINLSLGDSRNFLRHHLQEDQFKISPIFVYLDAHWSEDLPLLEECQIILRSGVEAVIMIDDFRVDHDPEYIFDDYGLGKALTLDYLGSLKSVSFFFPNCKAKTKQVYAKVA